MATASSTPTPVNTAKVAGRRMLRFETMGQMLAEVDGLIAAERAGKLRRLGNWTLGQALGHLGVWAEYSYTGAPVKPPLWVKWLVRLRKQAFLYGPMRAGIRISGIPGGTLAIDEMPLEEALPRFQRIMNRIHSEAPTAPNLIFGPLTHDEWIALQLRHAELHLGFFVPD
jgi:uncharacterized protein DUF1569